MTKPLHLTASAALGALLLAPAPALADAATKRR